MFFRKNTSSYKFLIFSSSQGSLTIQFMFGFVLVMCFILIFLNITLTLVASEITQYITYAASRSLFLAHGDEQAQETSAREKYLELTNKPHIKKFLGGGKVFEIASDLGPDNLGVNRSFQVPSINVEPNLFYGVWTDFTPKMLDVETPWGSVDEEDSFFKTVIGSYLGREPSYTECKDFFRRKWEFIKSLHGRSSYHFPSAWPVESDNGC